MNKTKLKLRPHHILDIVRGYGNGYKYTPHSYGHSQHLVAEIILSDINTEIELVVGEDAICLGCKYLQANGTCTDILSQLSPAPSKQEYNDQLDKKLFKYLGLKENVKTNIRSYLEIVHQFVPGIEEICTHPGEKKEVRLKGLINGLRKLGIK